MGRFVPAVAVVAGARLIGSPSSIGPLILAMGAFLFQTDNQPCTSRIRGLSLLVPASGGVVR
ncbi:hypothetical protein [Tautonia plasticadhaerens]|uniref:Uncharacterized protein n=1 Tax=Tautonia plasticadhaerens TaxID=2527974 RepID=A0A518H6I2_9BACT|nr:hypothetical protein [Tautonia plasticadhaerens]QDV36457.1 hypothetical protein ElP_43830 [Tautonia plasticadhaerens]